MSFQTPIARRKQPMYSEAEKETILLNLELERKHLNPEAFVYC